jgi:hypothetical protein
MSREFSIKWEELDEQQMLGAVEEKKESWQIASIYTQKESPEYAYITVYDSLQEFFEEMGDPFYEPDIVRNNVMFFYD